MRHLSRAALLSLLVLYALAGQAAAKLTPTVTTFPAATSPSAKPGPYAITAAADGNLWFADPYAHQIVRMTTEGTITLEAPVPASTFQYDIAAGADGGIWFVSQGPSSISRIDASGNILTKPFANALAQPYALTAGPEEALWIAEAGSRVIGRMPAVTPLTTPDESRTVSGEGPNDIAAGPDGALWFVQYNGNSVGRMAPTGAARYFELPPGYTGPEGIAAGPDGALWVTVLGPDAVVRVATDGTQTPYPMPATPFPGKIVAGPDGALWFTAFDEIVRVATDGSAEAFPLPDENAGANGITPGPDGNVWFTEQNSGRIGRITTPPNATTGTVEKLGARSATIAGVVAGHSQPTAVTVEYAPAGGAAATSQPVQLTPSPADQQVSVPIAGLVPRTAYRYRIVATNPTGSTSGAFGELTTTAPPRCKLKKAKPRAKGAIKLVLACSATETVRVKATVGKRLYGKARAKARKRKVTLRLKPTRRARARLARSGRARVKLSVEARGGDSSTRAKPKRVLVTTPPPAP